MTGTGWGAGPDAGPGAGPGGRPGAETVAEASGRPWRRRARRFAAVWPTAVLGAGLWVLLWGNLSWANVLAGGALGALVALAFPLPSGGSAATLRPWPLGRLVGRFVSDLVLASFQVARSAVLPGRTPRGGLVTVSLRSTSDLLISTTAGLASMVPGTLVVDLDPSGPTLQVHVLDLAGEGGPDAVRESIQALEERLLRAFAPRPELVRLGLVEPPAVTPGGAPTAGSTPAPDEEDQR